MAIVVYEKRTCTTCRNLATLFAERGIDFERVEYHVEGLARPQLLELIAKADVKPAELLRMREPGARELADEADDDAIVDAMVERPELLQRPVERVLEIL
ncbi:MAG TPA: ArsC/Spx/MgsR family protein [Thermoleophilaceae bacterium]